MIPNVINIYYLILNTKTRIVLLATMGNDTQQIMSLLVFEILAAIVAKESDVTIAEVKQYGKRRAKRLRAEAYSCETDITSCELRDCWEGSFRQLRGCIWLELTYANNNELRVSFVIRDMVEYDITKEEVLKLTDEDFETVIYRVRKHLHGVDTFAQLCQKAIYSRKISDRIDGISKWRQRFCGSKSRHVSFGNTHYVDTSKY